MEDCIFCKILKGELPSCKLYEDEHCIVILDIFPVSHGHSLIISKKHFDTLLDAPYDTVCRLLEPVKKTAAAVVKATKSDGFNLIQNNHRAAGQLIPHLHFHVIPRKAGDGLTFHWKQSKYPEGEMDKIADAISKNLANS